MSTKTNSLGFTLIELLVIISIIALLIAILLPALGAARSSAQQTQCLSNIKQAGTAAHTYAVDNKDYLPPKRVENKDTGFVSFSTFGWMGTAGDSGQYANFGSRWRHLNEYFFLGRPGQDDLDVPIARCPTDDAYGNQTLYARVGTSYNQVNNNTILDTTSADDVQGSRQIAEIRFTSKLVLGGEHGGVANAWGEFTNPAFTVAADRSWHQLDNGFSMTFVDGHADFINVPAPQTNGDRHLWDQDGRWQFSDEPNPTP